MRQRPEPIILDFETRSPKDLTKCGIWRYVTHPETEVLCYTAKQGDRMVTLFDADADHMPDWLWNAFCDKRVLVHAHNAAVERLIIQKICTVRHGWPHIATERFRCSAARVARMAIPRALDKAAVALGADIQKDAEGKKVMLRMTKPIPLRKGQEREKRVYDNDPVKLARVGEYNKVDVLAEEEIEHRSFPMPDVEERYYQLTERINDRGVAVDHALIRKLIWRANECADELNEKMDDVTDGAVRAVTEIQRLKAWITQETGISLSTMRKEEMETLLGKEGEDGELIAPGIHDFPKHVRKAIRLRQEGAKSSVSKLLAILQRYCPETGRVHHAFVFHGASTGRYTSMGVQLQNLVRETHKDFDAAIRNIDGFSLTDISKTIRGCFIPAPRHVYIDADYNAIEARGVGWLAGAKKLVQIYRDDGDPYCEMGGVIYGRVITKADEWERFVGKQTILGCGYGMGWKKFFDQCVKFGKPVTEEIAQKAIEAYRTEYPEIPQLWRDIEAAAIAAVRRPGVTTEIPNGKIQFRVSSGFLQMRLPSGKRLFYKSPRVRMVDKWGNGRESPELSYMAEHPQTKQWVRETTWGGKLTENAVQAICRELLFEAMYEIEYDKEIPLVLSVHDQIVAEVPEEDGEWAVRQVKRCMEREREWAIGFPVKAEPKITMRFGK